MAISSGVRQHRAWLSLNGTQFPVPSGSVSQTATKKSATFRADLPMAQPGLMQAITNLGENDASILVQNGTASTVLVSGEIDTVTFDYIGGLVGISGRCKSAKLHETKSSEKFTNQKTTDVVATLAGRVGLGTDIDQSTLQAGKYVQIDWAKITDGVLYSSIIHKIAELEGAKYWVSNGILHFKTSTAGAGVYVFTYTPPPPGGGSKVADFTKLIIEHNVPAGKTIKTTVKSWNSRKKKMFTGTSTIAGNKGTTNIEMHAPDLEQTHADKHAKSKARDAARHEYTVAVDCVGDPTIDVTMKLRLVGTQYHDQDYEIETIDHRFGLNGHSMSVRAKSSKKGRDGSAGGSSASSPSSPSQAGATKPTGING